MKALLERCGERGIWFSQQNKPPIIPTSAVNSACKQALGYRNAYYANNIYYEVESSEKEFREDEERFLPCVREHQIQPDSSGDETETSRVIHWVQ